LKSAPVKAWMSWKTLLSRFQSVKSPAAITASLQGGVQLIYQGKATKQTKVTAESLQRALDIMRDRVDAFGVSEPELARTGKDQIEVNLPGVKDAERAAQQVGSTAQLFFYDWEKNVLDESCKSNDTEINGGQQPITIRWLVVDPTGKTMEKAVVQRNKVPEGSLTGSWGQVAELAAGEAARSVAKLIKPTG